MRYDITSEGQKVRLYERLQGIAFLVKVLIGLVIILIVVAIAGFIISFGNDAAIMDMQTDTLDQIMEVRQMEPVEESEPVQPTSALTPDEFDLVCRVVMSESGGEDLQAQMAVAQTIYDRMHDFGETLPEAIKTYSQHDNGDPTDSVRLAVANVFEGGMRVFDGGTYQFHDDSVSPYWTEGKIDRGSIGNLRFYGGYEQ